MLELAEREAESELVIGTKTKDPHHCRRLPAERHVPEAVVSTDYQAMERKVPEGCLRQSLEVWVERGIHGTGSGLDRLDRYRAARVVGTCRRAASNLGVGDRSEARHKAGGSGSPRLMKPAAPDALLHTYMTVCLL